jgi:hypothetical protein
MPLPDPFLGTFAVGLGILLLLDRLLSFAKNKRKW